MKPREKILKMGVSGLTDRELLSLLIGTGRKGMSFEDVSRKVLTYLKLNLGLESLSIQNIALLDGVGHVKASRIIAGLELGRRLYTNSEQKRKVSSTADAAKFYERLGAMKREQIRVLYLNGRYELIKERLIALGSINAVGVSPREILSMALELSSTQIIVAHNHPTGDPTPSAEDIQYTKRLKEACSIIGIKLLDHIVIAKGGWKAIET